MARIRTIKPEFWTSEQLAECSPTARLLFVGIWTFADDGGVHPDSAKRLKMEIFPADDFTAAEVEAFLQELVATGLVKRFESEGQSYLWVTGWHHQKIDRPTYRHPQPSLADDSTSARRVVGEAAASPTPRNGVESSRVERNGVEGTSIDRSGDRPTEYVERIFVRGTSEFEIHNARYIELASKLGGGRLLQPRDQMTLWKCILAGAEYLPEGSFDDMVDRVLLAVRRGNVKRPFALLRRSTINEFIANGRDFHRAIRSVHVQTAGAAA